MLQPRRKWHSVKRNFQVDDLVIMVEDNVPRGRWSLGRVVQVFPDKAGNVRQVEVRASSKYYRRRPIAKLCLLEGVIED